MGRRSQERAPEISHAETDGYKQDNRKDHNIATELKMRLGATGPPEFRPKFVFLLRRTIIKDLDFLRFLHMRIRTSRDYLSPIPNLRV